MERIQEFIMNEMPLGALVFDEKIRVVYHNNTADKFLKRYGILPQLTSMAEKIFREQRALEQKTFSKETSFSRSANDLPDTLSVRCIYSNGPHPRISVFISIKPCNGELNAAEMIRRCDLTHKEAEIFRRLTRGLKNKDIALELNMQENTLRDHLRNIYTKCGVKGKLDLVRNIIA